MKTSIHCFGGNNRDIIGLQASRRSRSQNQNVDREIRTLWRVPPGVGLKPTRAARGGFRNARSRPGWFLAAGCGDRRRPDRVFFAGSIVFQPRRIGFDAQRAAIDARSVNPDLARPIYLFDPVPAGMRR
jgi:hypothetical protein